MRTVSSITEKKIYQKSMTTFLANEINSTGGDITSRKAHVQILFPLKDKICRVFEDIFKQSKKVKPCDITRCIEK